MMKVVRCIAEGEILGAECNTFQYVTDVVISSEKTHNTHTYMWRYNHTDSIMKAQTA